MSYELDNKQKKFLWQVYAASVTPRAAPAACGHEIREEKLWEYAQGEMPEEERTRFRQEIEDCPSCLQQLLAVQRAVNSAVAHDGYPFEEIKKLVDRQVSPVKKCLSSSLKVLLRWTEDSLELFSSTGQLLPARALPATRGEYEYRPVLVEQEFERCRVELSVSKTGKNLCDLEITISPTSSKALPSRLRANLFLADKLAASLAVKAAKTTFKKITPNDCRIALVDGNETWGEILLATTKADLSG